MLLTTELVLASLALSVSAVKTGRTFAVNHFFGNGNLVTERLDPIVSPGVTSGHVHMVQGGSNFAMTMSDSAAQDSTCTSSLVKADKSNYWVPSLYFQDPVNGSFVSVELYYMNVYYFFEATNDEIKAFEPGHRMVIGNPELRTPHVSNGGTVLDLAQGTPQPAQITCPRQNYNIPSYPAGSDGSAAGIPDPNNKGAGMGFPFMPCDGEYSPMRVDLHFPSCYNPEAGLDAYKTNMQFPDSTGTPNGYADCPKGWIHTPHLFYEVYWNTMAFAGQWTPNQGKQPFLFSNGDKTGFGNHGDFISGWDVTALQQIIDNCDAGDSGMDKCPGLIGGLNDPSTSCNINSVVDETIFGELQKLPGNNPPTSYGAVVGAAPVVSSGSSSVAAAPPASSVASSSVAAAAPATSSASTNKVVTGSAGSDTGSGAAAVVSHVSSSVAAPVSTPTPSSSTPAPITAPLTNAPAPGWKYNGCYTDHPALRTLSGLVFANLGSHNVTSTGCVAYCAAKGFSNAGTEYGGQCFCGNALSGSKVLAPSECSMKCEGDSSQICGGSLALSVYSKGGSARRSRHSHALSHVKSHDAKI